MLKTIRFVLLCCLLPVPAVGDGASLVEEAIAAMESVKMEQYAYTLTRLENAQTTVETYDPALADEIKWRLLSLDGIPPTEKELKKYRADKIKELKEQQKATEQNRKRGGPVHNYSYTDYFNRESIKLLRETAETAYYSFQSTDPSGSPFAKMMEKLTGTMRINKQHKYIESIFMEIPEAYSPILGVEITRFRMQMDFAPLGERGPVLLVWRNFELEGNLLLVKQLDQKLEAIYSDYRFKGGS